MQRESSGVGVSPFRRIIQVLGLLLALMVFEQNLEALARELRIHPTAGTLIGVDGVVRRRHIGMFSVTSLEPDSPLAAAGVRAGDTVTMDDPLVGFGSLSVRVPVGVTIDHAGSSRHLRLTPALIRGGQPSTVRLLLSVAFLVCDLLAAFLLICGHRRLSALELGVALAAFATPASYIQPLLVGSEILRWPMGVVLAATNVIAGLGFLTFALRIGTWGGGRNGPLTRAAAVIAGAVSLGVAVVDRTGLSAAVLPKAFSWEARLLTADILPLVVTLGILIGASRRADQDTWQRLATLVFGTGVIVFSQLVTDIGMAVHMRSIFSIGLYLQVGASIFGAGLMTYGVFGQRVIDVGLVINRTLVYALISVVLLSCFGLLEWAVNFFAPIRGRGQNAALGAGLALVVSLAFHRGHKLAENAVERLFFRRWREREEELRTFLSEAPFFKRPEALSSAALAAFRRFADDTSVAIYQRSGGGDFVRLNGCVEGFAERLDADMEMLVRLRARDRPIEVDSASLVLPMTTRNELSGVVILGCRPDRAAWRPDQIEELSGAARDIGHDLQVLEIDRLQEEVGQLSKKLALSNRPVLSALARMRGQPAG